MRRGGRLVAHGAPPPAHTSAQRKRGAWWPRPPAAAQSCGSSLRPTRPPGCAARGARGTPQTARRCAGGKRQAGWAPAGGGQAGGGGCARPPPPSACSPGWVLQSHFQLLPRGDDPHSRAENFVGHPPVAAPEPPRPLAWGHLENVRLTPDEQSLLKSHRGPTIAALDRSTGKARGCCSCGCCRCLPRFVYACVCVVLRGGRAAKRAGGQAPPQHARRAHLRCISSLPAHCPLTRSGAERGACRGPQSQCGRPSPRPRSSFAPRTRPPRSAPSSPPPGGCAERGGGRQAPSDHLLGEPSGCRLQVLPLQAGRGACGRLPCRLAERAVCAH